MIDKIFKLWNDLKPYLLPYFLIPLLIVYIIDYLVFLLWIVQICVISGIIFLTCGFFIGLALYIKVDAVKVPVFLEMRIIRFIPSIKWGYELMDWALYSGED